MGPYSLNEEDLVNMNYECVSAAYKQIMAIKKYHIIYYQPARINIEPLQTIKLSEAMTQITMTTFNIFVDEKYDDDNVENYIDSLNYFIAS